jgi:hypothetical protein
VIYLRHQAFFILVRGPYRTDSRARGLFTMEAGAGNIGDPDIRVLAFHLLYDIHPE